MTLFGRTLGGEEIAGLAFMLATLVLWLFVLRRERNARRWFSSREAGRDSRRDAEATGESGPDRTPSDRARGPWG